VAEKEAERAAGSGYWYGLWEDDALVGQIQIKKIERPAGRAEIAYLVDRDREGHGLVAEAMRAVLRVSFDDLGLYKVYLRTIVGNERSEALARRFGFVLEGTLRREHETPRDRLDVHYFGLLAMESPRPYNAPERGRSQPMANVKVGLLVRMRAKPGKEAEAAKFLEGALPAAQAEQQTRVWFALRIGTNEFGIFDAFPDESGRKAHLNGQIAAALMKRAPELFAEPPRIEQIDVLAAKLGS
jgi:quinol monooxygenase YgiN